MEAHVNTYRLASEKEVEEDLTQYVVSDQTARTIASWWHSPSQYSRNITALSHGRPFDTEELRDEVLREIADDEHQTALLHWLDNLEDLLSEV